jgi:DNA-binding CsgD family transcriptional regulator
MLDEELLGAIYEGPLETEPWQSFVHMLRVRLQAGAASLHLKLPSDEGPGFDVSDAEWDLQVIREHYEGEYFAYNPFDYSSMNTGSTYRWTDFTSMEELRDTDYYRDFCQPVGMEYALCLFVETGAGSSAWLSLVRSPAQGDFSDEEQAFLSHLAPHLDRSLRLNASLQSNLTERRAYQAAMEQLSIATLVLGAKGEVLSKNEIAEQICVGDSVLLRKGRLHFTNARVQNEFIDILNRFNTSSAGQEPEALSIERGEQPPLGLLVRPLQRQSRRQQSSAVAVAFITDPQSPQLAPQQLIAKLFGLTPTEARLATLLADGQSLTEVALSLGVSEGSARGYCKRIFAKTGINRQAELVRLVLKSVAPLGQMQARDSS